MTISMIRMMGQLRQGGGDCLAEKRKKCHHVEAVHAVGENKPAAQLRETVRAAERGGARSAPRHLVLEAVEGELERGQVYGNNDEDEAVL